jgi:hypothetical protein
MEGTIQAAQITILTTKHVTVATTFNKVTIYRISTTVLRRHLEHMKNVPSAPK